MTVSQPAAAVPVVTDTAPLVHSLVVDMHLPAPWIVRITYGPAGGSATRLVAGVIGPALQTALENLVFATIAADQGLQTAQVSLVPGSL